MTKFMEWFFGKTKDQLALELSFYYLITRSRWKSYWLLFKAKPFPTKEVATTVKTHSAQLEKNIAANTALLERIKCVK